MRLIAIVRHGEEEQGSSGMEARSARPLSARGRAQAEAAGRFLRGLADARVIASDVPRARETARLIAGPGRPVDEDPRLAPIDLGDWEGATGRLDDLAGRLRRRDGRPPGGESMADIGDRARAALADARRDEGDLILVAHRLPNAILIAEAMGFAAEDAWLVQQSHGAVSVLIEEEGRVRPATANVAPLDPLRRGARTVSVV